MTAGQVLYLLVTGISSTDFGPYKLTVKTLKPGESEFSAIDLGSDLTDKATGDTTGFPDSYTSNCTDGGDGPDLVCPARRGGCAPCSWSGIKQERQRRLELACSSARPRPRSGTPTPPT